MATNLGQGPEKLLRFVAGSKLPIIIQTEAAECGLVCLAMVAGYHGYDTDITSLRRRFSISIRGLNMSMLVDIASHLNLSSRVVKVEMDQLDHLMLPCILHWEMNHFVVLKSVERSHVVIHDPAIGERRIRREEFDKSFTGIALELTPTDDFEVGVDKVPLKISHFWSRIVGLKRGLANVFILSLLLQIFAIVSALYLQIVVDDVLLRDDRDLLIVIAIGFGLLALVHIATNTLRETVVLQISNLLNMQMAANLFRHLVRLPTDFFLKRHIGDIFSRFASLANVRDLLTVGLVSVLVDGLMAFITLAAMFFYSIKLTLIVLVIVVLYALLRLILYRPIRILNEEAIVTRAIHDSYFMETIRAIQTIKLFGFENDRQNQWQNRLADSLNKDIRIAQWTIRYTVIYSLLFGFENILVVYVAALAVMENQFTVGMLFAFMSFKGRFIGAMEALIVRWIDYKMLNLHLDRLSDIAFTPVERIYKNHAASELQISQGSEPRKSGINQGALEANDLSYRYGEHERYVFMDLNFSIMPGETVVFTGPSGCGKSTLIKCLMGLIQPTSGEILIDGVPLERIANYREQIAGIMQNDCLLSGTIADNITFFAEKADYGKIVACAKFACIHDEIGELNMKYDTLVGDMGSSLSGGQIQRIMLARALYRNPKILFLDEATSHLDLENERKISENIKRLNITRVLVAHRSETIEAADRRISLSD